MAGSIPLLIEVDLEADIYYDLPSDSSAIGWAADWATHLGGEWDAQVQAHIQKMESEAAEILGSVQFALPGSPNPQTPSTLTAGTNDAGSEAGGAPWRTVGTVAGALLAVATALAAAAAKSSAKTKTKQDPDEPIGYILELTARQLTISAKESDPLQIEVYQVMPDGSFIPAVDAAITVSAPAGVRVQPASGTGRMDVLVWQESELPTGAALVVSAATRGGGHQATVALTAEGESRLEVVFEPPDKQGLAAFGNDSVILVGRVILCDTDTADPTIDTETVRQSIDFTASSEWLDRSPLVDRLGGRAVRLAASQPNPDHPTQPPESVAVTCSASAGARRLSKTVSITLARNPVIDAAPTTISFMTETAETAQVRVWVRDGGAGPWSFQSEWHDGGKPLARVQKTSEESLMTTFTLTEASKGLLDPNRYEEASILCLTGTAQGYDALATDIKVIVTQEGFFVDPLGRDHTDDTFHIDARGSGRPTEIGVRVYVRRPDDTIAVDLALSGAVEWEPVDEPGTPAAVALQHESFSIMPNGTRDQTPPSAVYSAKIARVLPTGLRPIDASLRGSVPGHDEPQFTRLVPLTLVGVDMEPFSDVWDLERTRCLYAINTFMPPKFRDFWQQTVFKRERTLGAEGLFELRRNIWEFSSNALMKEGIDALIEADRWEAWEKTADWVSWTCELALQVAAGAYTGTAAMTAITMAKPLIIEAVNCYINGTTLEDFAWNHAKGKIIGAIEGTRTDVDVLTNLAGNRAVAWTIFIAYWTARDLYDEPNHSIANALTTVAGRVRDAALVSWLRVVAGTSIVKPGTKTIFGTTGPKEGTTSTTTKSTATKAPEKLTPKQVKDRTAAWERGKAEGQRKVDALEQAIKSGDPEKIRQAALDVQTDKQAIYAINRAGRTDATKAAMNAQMKAVYDRADEGTIARLAKDLGIPESDFQVLNPTNPKTKVSVGADRDVTIRMKAKPGDWVPSATAKGGRRQVKEGENVYVDVPASRLKKIYNEEFYKAAGGEKTGMTPDEFAKHMDQVATDRLHSEAYGRYADDLNTAIKKPGRGFTDPEQVGEAMGYKGHEWFNEAEKIRASDPERAEAYAAEGMRQTTKQFANQVNKRAGALGGQGHDVNIDPKLAKAIDEMRKVESGEKSPAQVEEALGKMGWTSADVATEIGKQVEMMQKLKPTS